jgi:hypothetical protein
MIRDGRIASRCPIMPDFMTPCRVTQERKPEIFESPHNVLILKPGQPSFQRLRFADSVKWIAQAVFDQHIDTLDDFPISGLPVEVMIPRLFRENYHVSRS